MRPEWIEVSKDPRIIALREDNAAELARLIDSGQATGTDAFHCIQTLLHVAAQVAAIGCARILLDHGAEIEALTEGGDSPLICAVELRHTDMAALLLLRGALPKYNYAPPNDPETQKSHKKGIEDMFEKISPEIKATFDKLGEQIPADIFNPAEMAQMVSNAAFQPREIHAIHFCSDLETLKLLIEKYASPINVIDDCGEWPLKSFARNGDAKAVAYLLQKGADPHLTSTGETALHAAVQGGNTDCVGLLLSAGADPNQQDVDMCVPLGSVQNAETLDLLLSAGADPNITDQAGFHPSYWIKDPILKKRVQNLEQPS